MPEAPDEHADSAGLSPAAPNAGGWLDGLLIAAVALLIYLALGQDAFYKIDGQVTLERVARAWIGHGSHLMADAWVRVFRDLVAPFDWTLYESVVAFSAASTAASLVPFHLAARRICARGEAAIATLFFAVAPAVVFYASVVEFHGPFMAFASLAFLAATLLGSAMSTRTIVIMSIVCGLLSSFAQLAHSSGAILPAVLVPWTILVARNRQPRPPTLILVLGLATAVVLHWAMLRGWPTLLRAIEVLEPKPEGRSALAGQDYLVAHLDTLDWGQARFAWVTLVYEWFWPFAAASVLAFVRPTLAWGRSILVVALLPYLGIAFLLMRHENEFGAYVMPCAWLACILAARAVQARTALLACVVAFLAAVSGVLVHDRDALAERYGSEFAALEAEAPAFVISGNEDERHYALMHLQHRKGRAQVAPAEELVVHIGNPTVITQHLDDYAKAGFAIVVTRSASRKFDANAAGQLVRALLERHYKWTATPEGALEGWYLVRKP